MNKTVKVAIIIVIVIVIILGIYGHKYPFGISKIGKW